MSEETLMDASTVTDDTASSTSTDDTDELDNEDIEQDEISKDDDPEKDEVEEPQKSEKDYKKAFHSSMSERRKLEREIESLKSNKSGEKNLSEDAIAKLKEKYDEDDLDVIQQIIKKEISSHESNKLEQKEESIFLRDHPEASAAQMKHLRFMQKEFGYSLKYAYDITFGKDSPKKETPKNHSISGATGDSAASKK
jgi:hypothetical protein